MAAAAHNSGGKVIFQVREKVHKGELGARQVRVPSALVDVIVVDPPRAGMHKFMTNYLPRFEAKKIVYISCNPTTQARDTEVLQQNGYQLKNLTMVDMFPHTPHVETVGIFEKK